MLKELSDIFHNVRSTKNKMLEADSNLERSMTIQQGVVKYSFHITCYKTRRQSLFKLLLSSLAKKKKLTILILNVLNISFTIFSISLYIFNQQKKGLQYMTKNFKGHRTIITFPIN